MTPFTGASDIDMCHDTLQKHIMLVDVPAVCLEYLAVEIRLLSGSAILAGA
jgi:hypothetical protein